MFNSQQVNNDPEPIRVMPDTRLEYRTESCVTKIPYETEFLYEPRPEYDNNPNPILLAFREDVEDARGDDSGIVEEWLAHLQDAEYHLNHPEEEVDHARKVLTKLVNVYGMEHINANDD